MPRGWQPQIVEPELSWGRRNFGADQQGLLATEGVLLLDDEFEVGRVMFEEFRRYRPLDYLLNSVVPTLVLHGDRDASVSYEIAFQAATQKPNTAFHSVEGSDHGFDTQEHEEEAVAATVEWLTTDHRRLAGYDAMEAESAATDSGAA